MRGRCSPRRRRPRVLLALAAPVLGLQHGDRRARPVPAATTRSRAGRRGGRRGRPGPGASAPVAGRRRGRAAPRGERARRAALAARPGRRATSPRRSPSRDGGARARRRRAARRAARPPRRRRPSTGCATALPAAAGDGRAGRRRRRDRRRRPTSSDLVSGSMWKILLFLLGLSLPRAARAAALRRAAAQGGADEPAQRRRGVRACCTLVFDDGRHAHAAARAGDRVRAVDGLRGVPALADPRALRGDRRHAPRGRRGPGRERAHDHLGGADHGRRLRGVHRGRRAVDPADRARHGGRDRARRDARAADPRPGDDGAARRVELVPAAAARADPAAGGLRGGARARLA